MDDADYFDQTRRHVIASRDALSNGLAALGFSVLPSAANFVFARHPARDAAALAIVCALVTVLAVPFTPPGIPLLVAAVVALLMHAVGRPSAADRSAGQSSGVGGSPE